MSSKGHYNNLSFTLPPNVGVTRQNCFYADDRGIMRIAYAFENHLNWKKSPIDIPLISQ